jgi:hypothetical protein
LDKVDENTVTDRTAAVMLIGLRDRCYTLNQCPREIVTLIAKMVYLKSLDAAWAKVRDAIESVVDYAKKAADVHHRHLQEIGMIRNY